MIVLIAVLQILFSENPAKQKKKLMKSFSTFTNYQKRRKTTSKHISDDFCSLFNELNLF